MVEICQCVGDKEWFDIVYESIGGGGYVVDMGVNVGDDQLIVVGFFQYFFQW